MFKDWLACEKRKRLIKKLNDCLIRDRLTNPFGSKDYMTYLWLRYGFGNDGDD